MTMKFQFPFVKAKNNFENFYYNFKSSILFVRLIFYSRMNPSIKS